MCGRGKVHMCNIIHSARHDDHSQNGRGLLTSGCGYKKLCSTHFTYLTFSTPLLKSATAYIIMESLLLILNTPLNKEGQRFRGTQAPLATPLPNTLTVKILCKLWIEDKLYCKNTQIQAADKKCLYTMLLSK